MKKLLLSAISLMMIVPAFSQDKDPVKAPSIGIHFLLNDFQTASYISSSSLSSTLLNKNFGKIKNMSPGFAVSFIKGLSGNLDFAGTIGGSKLDYTTNSGKVLGTNSLLLEVDAAIHAKMLPDNYWVVPYITAGVGISKYKGYYGAIMPLGLGIQVNVFKGFFVMIDSQYRLKVTETTNYHFMHSIGIVGNLKSL
jgi:OOP family OmpA-OmpF porin